MDIKTYTITISAYKKCYGVTVRTFHANGKMSVGEEQVFFTLKEALQFVESEETALNHAKS